MAASNAKALRVLAAAPEHAPGVANVAARSLPDPWPAAMFRRELERPMSRGRVALRGASCVAYVLGWRVLDEVEVLSLAVDPPWRRRGVGRRLLDSYLSELRGEGVRRDLLLAYLWYTLAARQGDEFAAAALAGLALSLSPEQIAAAEALARDWTPAAE